MAAVCVARLLIGKVPCPSSRSALRGRLRRGGVPGAARLRPAGRVSTYRRRNGCLLSSRRLLGVRGTLGEGNAPNAAVHEPGSQRRLRSSRAARSCAGAPRSHPSSPSRRSTTAIRSRIGVSAGPRKAARTAASLTPVCRAISAVRGRTSPARKARTRSSSPESASCMNEAVHRTDHTVEISPPVLSIV